MKNVHIIYSNWNREQIRFLKEYHIEVELGFNSFTIEENENYLRLKPHLDKWKVEEEVFSSFSNEDIVKANFLILRDTWTNGYPMPDINFGYRNTTYNSKNYCEHCGIGLIQKEPFRLKKAPNWGNKNVFMLNWVFDEFFVRKDLYLEVFRKYNVEALPVLLHKKETIIEDTVQLKIPYAKSSFDLKAYNFQICNICKRKRYDLVNMGYFPSVSMQEDNEFFKSNEDFGTGANARKYVFLSKKLRMELLKYKVKANYIPCVNS